MVPASSASSEEKSSASWYGCGTFAKAILVKRKRIRGPMSVAALPPFLQNNGIGRKYNAPLLAKRPALCNDWSLEDVGFAKFLGK